MDSIDKLILGGAAYTLVKQNWASADAKLAYKGSLEQLDYFREKDLADRKSAEHLALLNYDQQNRDREFQQRQVEIDRKEAVYLAREEQLMQAEMQRREHQMREQELEMERERIEAENYIAELNAETNERIASLNREADLIKHSKRLEQERILHSQAMDLRERLEQDKLRVSQNIAKQEEALQRYLFEQGNINTQEIEKFKALALRETQILLARENAANILQDKLVQDALKDFPLNISPLVLLKNRPHELTNLLRFTLLSKEDGTSLPDIANVYADVKNYAKNPEPLNIFITPIHISSSLTNSNNLTQQIWDVIYQKIESFFTVHYNRKGEHPVVFYPTAWKDSSAGGQHTSETLHFFLKDMPCLVIEPRFDGHSLNLMVSAWNNGYISSDHIRVKMDFEINLYSYIIQAAYERSVKSLNLLNKVGTEHLDDSLIRKKRILEQNIRYYESLDLKERIESNDLDDIEALGIYNLFEIEPSKDLNKGAEAIASIICINLAVIADVHHLQSTDAVPVFPSILRSEFPDFFRNENLRSQLAESYETVYLNLRNQDSMAVGEVHRKEMERAREVQIINVKKELGIIGEEELQNDIEVKLRNYAQEKYKIKGYDLEELCNEMIKRMDVNDIPFFKEVLPNIDDRRLYKRIDKRISDLQR